MAMTTRPDHRFALSGIVLFAAAAVLAIEPIRWLLASWRDPAFDSDGFFFFLLSLGLFGWSLTSPIISPTKRDVRLALCLFALTAIIRLTGQVWDIDTISALALVIDVYALCLILGTHRRGRPIAPFWLAVAFAFALPLERVVQRLIGFGLQSLSASGACSALNVLFDDVTCDGVRIAINSTDVLVDLPCSGAEALLAFGFMYAVCAAITRPNALQSALGALLALGAAILANIVRITLLASGIALGPDELGVDVMVQPWHDIVGGLAWLAYLPALWIWGRWVWRTSAPTDRVEPDVCGLTSTRALQRPLLASIVCLVTASAVAFAPARPQHLSASPVTLHAPASLGSHRAILQPLSAMERAYFAQYGGVAVKARYGAHALLLTRTSSPLRHLHAPDECLRGLGFKVDYTGMQFAPIPTAIYRASAPDGSVYRVETSFLSNEGHATGNVAEAVWIWLRHPNSTWTGVQRITDWAVPESDRRAFEAAVFASLDIGSSLAPSTHIAYANDERGDGDV